MIDGLKERRDSGDLLGVHDLTIDKLTLDDGELDQSGDHLNLKHLAVLSLARSGALRQAEILFKKLGLARFVHEHKIKTLQTRLLKDRALGLKGRDRLSALKNVADRYNASYKETGDPYPGINAATMYLIAGDEKSAGALAARILEEQQGASDQNYYHHVTTAEANLICKDIDAAQAALDKSMETGTASLDDIVGTRRQLQLICKHHNLPYDLLAPLKLPSVAHFCGHLPSKQTDKGRLLPADEESVADKVKSTLADNSVGFLFGALAAGADIIVAEQALRLGIQLHVVLPWEADVFANVSVSPSGKDWTDRFHRCLNAANVTVSTNVCDTSATDGAEVAAASEYAMGLALSRAKALGSDALQIAVYDGRTALDGPIGTANDISRWEATSHRTILIPPPSAKKAETAPTAEHHRSADKLQSARQSRAMLFCDFAGFSTLDENEIRQFVDELLTSANSVLEKYGSNELLFANTWGDGVFLVFQTATLAAECALALQQLVMDLPADILGLPDGISLRVGGHCGPVLELRDPITKKTGYFGTSVNRAARIEPVTPPDEVYVSEAFAAKLALEEAPFFCEYVGEVASAKNYGRFRMFLLRHDADAEPEQQR